MVLIVKRSAYEITTFNGSISNIKTSDIGNGTIAFACTAPTTPSGKLYNPANEKKPLSSAKVYTSLFVRHWDSWVPEQKSGLFYGALKRIDGSIKLQDKLQDSGLVNALAGTKLECPVPPFGDAGDYDIGPEGIVFVSKDPELNPALYTKSDLYYVPLKTFTEEKPPPPQIIPTADLQGYTGSPVFSHSGKAVAFKRMRNRQYESDRSRLFIIPDIHNLALLQTFWESGEGGWVLQPDGILWSHDDSELYVTGEKFGRQGVYRVSLSPLLAKELPQQVTTGGTVGSFHNLARGDRRLFITSSSLVDNSSYSILDPKTEDVELISSSSKEGKSFGLAKSQVGEFWFKGANKNNRECHALVMKPSNFDPEKKYPLAFLIHGGPQGAWGDSWSTRWNPAIFAEQGYVAVMPNPTGSTGYGQQFTDDIAKDWGGLPYNDREWIPP